MLQILWHIYYFDFLALSKICRNTKIWRSIKNTKLIESYWCPWIRCKFKISSGLLSFPRPPLHNNTFQVKVKQIAKHIYSDMSKYYTWIVTPFLIFIIKRLVTVFTARTTFMILSKSVFNVVLWRFRYRFFSTFFC